MYKCGNRVGIMAYVTPDVYNWLMNEKGNAKMSTYITDLLTTYVDMVKSEEQEGVNENEK